MGHDHHFLSRLDRATRDQVDLALALYRDQEVVKYILAIAKAEAGTRIAISLDRDEGPFLVLAHDGHFVTCLGRGMSPAGMPRFSRTWLDATMRAYGQYRDGVARARRRTADQDSTGGLLRAIGWRAHNFSREDFAAIRPLAGVLGMLWIDWVRSSFAAMANVFKRAIDGYRAGRTELPAITLETYWKAIWGSSHAIVLAGCAGDDIAARIGRSWKNPHSPTVGLCLPDIQILAVRAAWFAAQHGDVLLPHYDRALRAAEEEGDVYDACAALLAIAVKWPFLRAPVRRVFDESPVRTELEPLRAAYVVLAKEMLAEPTLAEEIVLEYGQQFASAVRDTSAEPAPLELVRSYGIVNPADAFVPIVSHSDRTSRILLRLAAVCSAAGRDAEVLFLPEADNLRLAKGTSTALARSNIDSLMNSRLGEPPVRRPVTRARVGRNDPCPCGSGKKVKRCCAGTSPLGSD